MNITTQSARARALGRRVAAAVPRVSETGRGSARRGGGPRAAARGARRGASSARGRRAVVVRRRRRGHAAAARRSWCRRPVCGGPPSCTRRRGSGTPRAADARRRRLGARAADAHAEAVARRERVVDREGPAHDARDDAEVRLPRRPVLEGAARRRRRPRVQRAQQKARGAVVEAVAIFDRRVGEPRARQRVHRHTIVQAIHAHVGWLAQHRVVLCPKQYARRAPRPMRVRSAAHRAARPSPRGSGRGGGALRSAARWRASKCRRRRRRVRRPACASLRLVSQRLNCAAAAMNVLSLQQCALWDRSSLGSKQPRRRQVVDVKCCSSISLLLGTEALSFVSAADP